MEDLNKVVDEFYDNVDDFIEYQKDIDAIYKQTEEFTRSDFVRIIYDLREELADFEESYYKDMAEAYRELAKVHKKLNSLQGNHKKVVKKSNNRYQALKNQNKIIEQNKKLKEENTRFNGLLKMLVPAEMYYQESCELSPLDVSNNKLKKIEEYLTSYESISTIQGFNDTKENKNLDKNTMVEMTNRYLKVHDKILKIIKGDEDK